MDISCFCIIQYVPYQICCVRNTRIYRTHASREWFCKKNMDQSSFYKYLELHHVWECRFSKCAILHKALHHDTKPVGYHIHINPTMRLKKEIHFVTDYHFSDANLNWHLWFYKMFLGIYFCQHLKTLGETRRSRKSLGTPRNISDEWAEAEKRVFRPQNPQNGHLRHFPPKAAMYLIPCAQQHCAHDFRPRAYWHSKNPHNAQNSPHTTHVNAQARLFFW